MKKKSLNLSELKVQSFVTSMNNETAQTAKGGDNPSIQTVCNASCICLPKSDDCIATIDVVRPQAFGLKL